MDDYTLICPCCKAELEVDDCGDLALIELPELAANQHRGLGNLVVENVGPDRRTQYLQNQQTPEQAEQKLAFNFPTLNRAKPDIASAPIPETSAATDEALIAASEADLQQRNIKSKTKSTKK